jgi:hypothetical protein
VLLRRRSVGHEARLDIDLDRACDGLVHSFAIPQLRRIIADNIM